MYQKELIPTSGKNPAGYRGGVVTQQGPRVNESGVVV